MKVFQILASIVNLIPTILKIRIRGYNNSNYKGKNQFITPVPFKATYKTRIESMTVGILIQILS
jgi:hypothetical protein